MCLRQLSGACGRTAGCRGEIGRSENLLSYCGFHASILQCTLQRSPFGWTMRQGGRQL
jgi:hypothetical protein